MPDVRKFGDLYIDLDEVALIERHEGTEAGITWYVYLKGCSRPSGICGTPELLQAFLEKHGAKE